MLSQIIFSYARILMRTQQFAKFNHRHMIIYAYFQSILPVCISSIIYYALNNMQLGVTPMVSRNPKAQG